MRTAEDECEPAAEVKAAASSKTRKTKPSLTPAQEGKRDELQDAGWSLCLPSSFSSPPKMPPQRLPRCLNRVFPMAGWGGGCDTSFASAVNTFKALV